MKKVLLYSLFLLFLGIKINMKSYDNDELHVQEKLTDSYSKIVNSHKKDNKINKLHKNTNKKERYPTRKKREFKRVKNGDMYSNIDKKKIIKYKHEIEYHKDMIQKHQLNIIECERKIKRIICVH